MSHHVSEKVARKVFEKRGNHSEAHLSEAELKSIIDVAIRIAATRSANSRRVVHLMPEPEIDV